VIAGGKERGENTVPMETTTSLHLYGCSSRLYHPHRPDTCWFARLKRRMLLVEGKLGIRAFAVCRHSIDFTFTNDKSVHSSTRRHCADAGRAALRDETRSISENVLTHEKKTIFFKLMWYTLHRLDTQ